ncbi:MAG: peptide deformylase [Lentisphaeria bacterium]|jgi:peptide deformylase
MSILTILEFPDPRLRTVAKPVEVVNVEILQLIDDMLETMYEAPGIGLAASQVNVHQQVIVIDISNEKNQPQVFINPEITVLDAALFDYEEGCLSVPGFYEEVVRPEHIRVTALDRNGKPFTIEPKKLLAVCIQHEVDHLKGKLFVDYISNIKRQRIRKKLEKQHKVHGRV